MLQNTGLTPQQHAERAKFIGASEIAAVCGQSPWETPLDVWMRKTGRKGPTDSNEPMYWGIKLEPLVAERFAEGNNLKVRNWAKAYERQSAHMGAHVDRLIEGTDMVLECKTCNTFSDWPKEDEIPPYYYLQCQQILYCASRSRCWLAVLVGGQEYKQYPVDRDEETIKAMVSAAQQFWGFVERNTPPPAININDLEQLMFGKIVSGKMLIPQDHEDTLHRLVGARAHLKAITTEKQDLEFEIKNVMQESAVMVDIKGTPLVTWKQNKDRVVTDHQGAAQGYFGLLDEMKRRLDPHLTAQYDIQIQRVRDESQSVKAGNRMFLVKDKAIGG